MRGYYIVTRPVLLKKNVRDFSNYYKFFVTRALLIELKGMKIKKNKIISKFVYQSCATVMLVLFRIILILECNKIHDIEEKKKTNLTRSNFKGTILNIN